MSTRCRQFLFLGLLGSISLGLAGCGGGGGGSPTPVTPPPTPTPPPPPVVVAQGGGSLPVEFVARRSFTTTVAGALTTTVDWTFARNDLDVYLTSGNCSFEQFFEAQCPELAFSESTTAKPERITVAQAPAGAYTLFVANFGPGDESFSFQVVLTPSASSAAVSRAGKNLPLGLKRVPRGVIELQ